MRYVITGCAGSATLWASRVMTALGSHCSHEKRFAPDPAAVADGVEGESSWLAARGDTAGLRVAVIVRHPLLVVRSMSRLAFLGDDHARDFCGGAFTRYALERFPELGEAQDKLGRLLLFVHGWDQPARATGRVVRVEDLDPPRLARLHRYLTGRQVSREATRVTLRRLGSTVNTHRGHRSGITLAEIRRHPYAQLYSDRCRELGYREELPV